MKVLRTTEDVLALKNGDKVLLGYVVNGCSQLVLCEFKIPYSGWSIGVKIEQRPYSLVAASKEQMAHYLGGRYNLQLYKG